jgi:hypothetical protein
LLSHMKPLLRSTALMGLSPRVPDAAAAASTALLCVTGSQRNTMSCSLGAFGGVLRGGGRGESKNGETQGNMRATQRGAQTGADCSAGESTLQP